MDGMPSKKINFWERVKERNRFLERYKELKSENLKLFSINILTIYLVLTVAENTIICFVY